MKLLFIFVAAISFVNVNCTYKLFKERPHSAESEAETDAEASVVECAAQNKLDDKMVSDMIKSGTFSTTDASKSFASCVVKRAGLMNEDGSWSKAFMDDPEVEKCKNLGGKDQHESAAKVIECLYKEERD